MKEKDKYYKPSIEEFYDGFECEFKSAYQEGVGDDWQKIKYTQSRNEHFRPRLENYLKYNQYRVKYLDKEDIKGLGFKYIGKGNNLGVYETEEIWKPKNYLSNRGIKLRLTHKLNYEKIACIHLEFYEMNYFEWYTCFEGVIKNKSELKQLLKQLGIGFKVKDNKE